MRGDGCSARALDDRSSCPHTSPRRLTPAEIRTIKDMVTAVEYRHVPTGRPVARVTSAPIPKAWGHPRGGKLRALPFAGHRHGARWIGSLTSRAPDRNGDLARAPMPG